MPKETERPSLFPERVGDYVIECPLAIGGMSQLYLAINLETHAFATVKVIDPQHLADEDGVRRFLNEAETLARTDHTGIVKLYSYGNWEGGLYIAMEHIDGTPLSEVLPNQPLSLRQALEILLQVGYAVCHLHTHGLIHRDLKPENILLNRNQKVKLIDFGVTTTAASQQDIEADTPLQFIGTPIYMSPEQRINPANVSFSSDIYALAIIAYELITGRLCKGQVHLSLIPDPLRPILAKALQEDPKDRYQDLVDFISDISNFLESDYFRDSDPTDEIRQPSLVKTPRKWNHMTPYVSYHNGWGKGVNAYYFSEHLLAGILPHSNTPAALLDAHRLLGVIEGVNTEDMPLEKVHQKIGQATSHWNDQSRFSMLLLHSKQGSECILEVFSSDLSFLWKVSPSQQTVTSLKSETPIPIALEPGSFLLHIHLTTDTNDLQYYNNFFIKKLPEWVLSHSTLPGDKLTKLLTARLEALSQKKDRSASIGALYLRKE